MVCCKSENRFPTPPQVSKYPCKLEVEKPILQIGLEELLDIYNEKEKAKKREEELQRERERNKPVAKKPCEGVRPPTKKQFEQRKTCTSCFPRRWNVEDSPDSELKEFPKNFPRRGKAFIWREKCPRELDDYEKSLWTPVCKAKKKPPGCREPVDRNLCVFCLENFYTNGFLHELFEKTPLIKKQSELKGDEIAERIGIRTRIIVHKKCYDSYTQDFPRDEEKGNELDKNDDDDDDEDNCEGEKQEEEEREGGVEEDEDEEEGEKKKTQKKPPEEWKCHYKQHFCLRNHNFPTAGSSSKSVEMGRFKAHGLVADLWPNIRLLQLSGHFLHEYHDDNSAMNVLMRKMYSTVHLILIFAHFAAIIANLAMEADDVNILAANSITVLFFTHCITKFCYFALRRNKFYRTLAVWDTQNSHPLFAESHARHRAVAITKSRRLLMITVIGTLLTVVGWTGSTFFGESTKTVPDPQNNNETIKVEIPRLMVRAWYPWDASSGSNYMFSFIYQLYWLVFTLFHANLVDLLFCSWLIFACEQLLHVKEIMKPLIDLSSSLDTYNPGSSELFKAAGAITDNVEEFFDSKDDRQINIRSIYSNMRDFGLNRNNVTGAINAVNGIGPNGLSKKHEMLVRSAIKYWVERHKHIVRYVGSIGDAYGLALLLHMLTSTITLTLLAYQATKIDGMDLYAMTVLGYLFYSLAQVFAFCIYGNQLIEESSSVMEAAYSCQWYDGSEEAKTFVQIVCQQCQKALSISGAKFFTVSLDLFASVLGAVVTYFMVLVQLK